MNPKKMMHSGMKQHDGDSDDVRDIGMELSRNQITKIKMKRILQNPAVKLMSRKRKFLECGLSARECGQLELLKESKDEYLYRKKLYEILRESVTAFSNSVNTVSKAMPEN